MTSPVNAYKPNSYGLYNTVGNVWEWTNDWKVDGYDEDRSRCDAMHAPSFTNAVVHPVVACVLR